MPTTDLYSAPDIIPQIVGQKTFQNPEKAASIRVISDGTAGMRLQALALGEAIKASRHPPTNLEDIIITPPPLPVSYTHLPLPTKA